LRDAGDGFAGRQHRRGGGRVEGDDGGEGADDDQDKDAKGDEDPAKHGCIFVSALRPIHRLCAKGRGFRDRAPIVHSRSANGASRGQPAPATPFAP
jgi:hypothetical protein